ncbi:MAG TPA: M14 family zinc carboxypeptidase [Vicinamibacterales bacterium]|nr:M14 family zinc carboxypeptidase [Vicinamibacterales bacterium]
MKRRTVKLGLALALVFAAIPARPVFAQGDPAALKPGRDPKQAIDEEYTKKIKEYTTEPFFLSPLVDYMPASKTVPTPTATLGDIAGAPTKLPYSKEVYEYMRLLAKSSPRVKVFSIGTTEEGREMIAVAVASEALIAKLDVNKAALAKLADPRTINFNDAEADKIAATAAPVYYITGTIHSTEAGAPTALMELAYRLAVDESPYIKNIRDHVITLITPIVEVDGRDRTVDLFNWHVKHPNEVAPSLVYWGHYVAHDNNRDAMGMTLKLTQNVLNTYVGWKATVLHDLHESEAFLYDNTIGDGPYNAWLDPLLTNEWQMIGWNNVQEMTRFGMPGVYAHGDFDTWSPGYLMFIAATHNGISRLYETFGNGGTAETVDRTLSPAETERTWFKQNPPIPHVKWSLRNNNNYEQTGLLVSLAYVANNRHLFLENFYEKSKRSIMKPKVEGPAAYVFSANDPRLGSQADLLRVLQKQAVEISRATAPFSVTMPVKRAAGGGGRSGRGAGAPEGGAPTTETREFPAGSYIVRMDQPYSRIADALLDYQYWSPNDPQKTPYDDTGWTFPEGFDVQVARVTDVKVLDAPMQRVTGEITAPGGVAGSGTVYAINGNGDNALATLRYRLKDADFQATEDAFDAGGAHFNRGSFIVRNVPSADLDKAAKELGIKVTALSAAPSVKMHPARAARIAILHTWSGTQTEGWWREAFDQLQIPYTYISTQDVAKDANLNAKYDVIVFPPAGGSGQSIIDGMPMWRNPMPWKNSPETPNIGTWAQTDDVRPGLGYTGLENLQNFVKRGGVMIGATNTADFTIQFGLANGVSSNGARRGEVVGTLLRTRMVDETSPIAYGVSDNLAVYSNSGESFGVSASRGGRGGGGGRFGGGGTARATGRGTQDDADQVQGFPQLDPQFLAPPRTPVQPWQYAPVTEDQLRNPLNIIPPDQRPRVILRYADQRDLLVSGLLDGGADIAQRPAVVDSPMEKGHVVLFAMNPVYRGETIGSYFLVFNTIMNFDNLNAGRKVDAR